MPVSAVVLLGRLGVHTELTRDESVYAYAGQQPAHRVPPYSSILDPKGPLAAFLAALGALLGSLTGHSELIGMRLVLGLVACAGVLTTNLLARRIWDSTFAGVGAAVGL